MPTVTYRVNTYLATATAIILSLPPVGSAGEQSTQAAGEFKPLDETSSKLVTAALQLSPYVLDKSLALFSLLSEVAVRLVKDSKPLDSDFSSVVDKEFWNLLR
jgi:hypothetical protein